MFSVKKLIFFFFHHANISVINENKSYVIFYNLASNMESDFKSHIIRCVKLTIK